MIAHSTSVASRQTSTRQSAGQHQGQRSRPKASSLHTLRRRQDFVRVARGRRCTTGGLVLQARRHGGAYERDEARVGFTCSRRIGSAVVRNRCRRRLKSVARIVLAERAQAGWDYVLIGRRNVTNARQFPDLVSDLHRAIDRVHRRRRQP